MNHYTNNYNTNISNISDNSKSIKSSLNFIENAILFSNLDNHIDKLAQYFNKDIYAIHDTSDLHKSFIDLIVTSINKEDKYYIECKTDTYSNTGNICIELLQNINMNELKHFNERIKYGRKFNANDNRIQFNYLHKIICKYLTTDRKALGLSQDLPKKHYTSYYMPNDGRWFLIDTNRLRLNFIVPLLIEKLETLTYTISNRGNNKWLNISMLINIDELIQCDYVYHERL